jgi:hypothetical protein
VTSFDTPFHVGIASPDVASLASALGPLLGLTWVSLSRPDVVHQTPHGPVAPASQVIWSRSRPGAPHVELVKAEPGTVYALDRGTFIHHFGYWTPDLTGSITDYQAQGWRVEATMLDGAGQPTAFAYLSRPGEVWIELVDVANQPRLAAELGPRLESKRLFC